MSTGNECFEAIFSFSTTIGKDKNGVYTCNPTFHCPVSTHPTLAFHTTLFCRLHPLHNSELVGAVEAILIHLWRRACQLLYCLYSKVSLPASYPPAEGLFSDRWSTIYRGCSPVFDRDIRLRLRCPASIVLLAVDRGNSAALVLLDLSAAFDHEVLFQRLRVTFGIHDTVNRWSHVFGRTQNIRCGLLKTLIVRLTCGVPQGSVLDPIFYTINLM